MPFQFKNFFIDDTNTPMKVGIDGVLLGVWSEAKNNSSILDVGAGSGLVSLILAQRYIDAEIFAIEIHSDAYIECNKNFDSSPWKSRLEALFGDFVSYNFRRTFDLIVTNPPYFEAKSQSLKSGRKIARENNYLPLDLFFRKSKSMLSDMGEIIIIYPFEQRNEAITNALLNNMYLTKELRIRDTQTAIFKRSILCFSQSKELNDVDIKIISLKDDKGVYSHEFKLLTNEFYL